MATSGDFRVKRPLTGNGCTTGSRVADGSVAGWLRVRLYFLFLGPYSSLHVSSVFRFLVLRLALFSTFLGLLQAQPPDVLNLATRSNRHASFRALSASSPLPPAYIFRPGPLRYYSYRFFVALAPVKHSRLDLVILSKHSLFLFSFLSPVHTCPTFASLQFSRLVPRPRIHFIELSHIHRPPASLFFIPGRHAVF